MAIAQAQDPHERAKRLARLIVADIIYYNQDKIALGIREDRLFDLLAKDLAEVRKYYETQVDSEVNKTTPYFDWALVDQLVKTKGSGTQSKIW